MRSRVDVDCISGKQEPAETQRSGRLGDFFWCGSSESVQTPPHTSLSQAALRGRRFAMEARTHQQSTGGALKIADGIQPALDVRRGGGASMLPLLLFPAFLDLACCLQTPLIDTHHPLQGLISAMAEHVASRAVYQLTGPRCAAQPTTRSAARRSHLVLSPTERLTPGCAPLQRRGGPGEASAGVRRAQRRMRQGAAAAGETNRKSQLGTRQSRGCLFTVMR